MRSTRESGIIASSNGRIRKHEIKEQSDGMTVEKAYVMGVLCGDGYMHRTKNDSFQIGLSATDNDFVLEFSRCVNQVYGITPSINRVKSKRPGWREQTQARICSKEVFSDILGYGNFGKYVWRVPDTITESTQSVRCSCLKGFFDSEGTVDDSKKITAVSVNSDGIADIGRLLSSLGVAYNVRAIKNVNGNRKECYVIKITGRRYIESYMKNIGFSIKRKQEKLEHLLDSYKLNVTPHREILEMKDRMEELRRNGLSYSQISKELGIGITTVWNCLNPS